MSDAPADSAAQPRDLTMTILGCGTMGIAIVSGILATLKEIKASGSRPDGTPANVPTQFIACVECEAAADNVTSQLSEEYLKSVKVVINENVESVRVSDFVLLSCKPYVVEEIMKEPGMAVALDGKPLVSICAGVSVEQIEGYIAEARPADSPPPADVLDTCRVVRVMPNTASLIREGMTVVATSTPPLRPEQEALVGWVFKMIGDVIFLPPKQMDVVTALCGSAPAFCLLMIEAMADGAVAMGLPRAEAQRCAAQVMKGAAGLVINGEHPAVLRDRVCTPGGCTIGGLMVMEEGRVRGAVSRAVREATVVASQLGQGVQGVNGTRFTGSQMP